MYNATSLSSFLKVLIVLFLGSAISLSLSGQGKYDYKHRHDLTYKERVVLGEKHFDRVGKGKGVGYKQFKRWKYWAKKSLNSNGYVITKSKATKEVQKFNKKYNINTRLKTLSTEMATELGPRTTNITTSHSSALGRVLSIAVAPGDNFNHVIIASDGGGVWKTLDDGMTWTPLFEDQVNMTVLSVAISHANDQHYYAGLEETGLSRSIDGGANWTQATGIGQLESIEQIDIHPTTASIVYAISGGEGKLYRSTDSGANFSVLHNFGSELTDLEFKPGDATTMYISGLGGGTKIYR